MVLQRWCRRCWAVSESDDKELRPLTEDVEREGEERRERWRRVLVVALLCIISFLVAIAYSVVGSFFPIQVSKLAIDKPVRPNAYLCCHISRLLKRVPMFSSLASLSVFLHSVW